MSTATTIAPTHTDEDIENLIIQDIAKNETISNSRSWAASHNIDHERVVGNLNSLVSAFLLDTDRGEESTWGLTGEALDYIKFNATPEVQVFNAIPKEGAPKAKLVELLGGDQRAKLVESVGFGTALKNKWIANQKGENGPVVLKLVPSVEDTVLDTLKKVANGIAVSEADLTALKRRKLVENKKVKYFIVKKGAKFTTERKKQQSDLTTELLVNSAWENESFKSYNFNAKGKKNITGYLHPLLKVRTEFRNIFLEMGFEEMKTNQFVESSFWNFDALFQPQAHPVRDAHDTFFMKDPAETLSIPQDYLEKVKEIHEKGGYESIGYRYDWKVAEAKKNILRTHTTAVSSRYLYKMGKAIPTEGFTPKKYFSIDRVFRNEVPDQTHLCEFHQIEGMVIDKGLTLGDMISLFSTFFAKIGIHDIKFKPAFNPYTEPSMEIFGFHPQLQRWVEVGNSGVFRPEMLRPMGLPEDVTVIAWGLSLERPTMILYEVDDIRDLVGHKVNIAKIRSNPICRLDKESKPKQEATATTTSN